MKITVLLFASVREQCGRSAVELDLPAATRVEAVLDHLITDATRVRQWRACLMFAVNNCYVASSLELREGDVVALIPPVAGG